MMEKHINQEEGNGIFLLVWREKIYIFCGMVKGKLADTHESN